MAVWSPDCPVVECVAQAGLKFLFQSDAVISGCCHHTRLICYPADLEASWNPLEAWDQVKVDITVAQLTEVQFPHQGQRLPSHMNRERKKMFSMMLWVQKGKIGHRLAGSSKVRVWPWWGMKTNTYNNVTINKKRRPWIWKRERKVYVKVWRK